MQTQLFGRGYSFLGSLSSRLNGVGKRDISVMFASVTTSCLVLLSASFLLSLVYVAGPTSRMSMPSVTLCDLCK